MARLPRNNNPAEIEAFDTVCHRLAGFGADLSAEWVDGYLTALASGPSPLAIEAVLQAMAGDAYERAFADPEDQALAQRALRTRAVVLADQLDPEALFDAPDQLRLAPLMLSWDSTARAEAVAEGRIAAEHVAELVTGAEWADGFFAALDRHSAAWPVAVDDDQAALFRDLLQQVHALRLAEGSDELRQHIAATYRGEALEAFDRERLVDEACYAVQDLRLYWVDNAPRPATRRVEKTPGRNDPCPCGSGKKFKKCHGLAPV
jgi:uncharacterized protein